MNAREKRYLIPHYPFVVMLGDYLMAAFTNEFAAKQFIEIANASRSQPGPSLTLRRSSWEDKPPSIPGTYWMMRKTSVEYQVAVQVTEDMATLDLEDKALQVLLSNGQTVLQKDFKKYYWCGPLMPPEGFPETSSLRICC
jgi:hypothetical protein